jgi:group I intron endonuclease
MININSEIPIIGIYKITSPSGKNYIGQSVNIKRRWKNYTWMHVSMSGPYLMRSLKKHKPENHIFEIIEECSIEQLNERETYWKQCELDKVNGDWSKVLFCDLYDRGGGPRSEQTKAKISKANKGKKRSKEYAELIGNLKRGVPKPKGYGEKLSIILSGKTRTKETKQLLSDVKKGIPNLKNRKPKPIGFGHNNPGSPTKPVCQISPVDNKIIKIYPSATIASELTGIDAGNISRCCTGKGITAGKYKWVFNNNYNKQ